MDKLILEAIEVLERTKLFKREELAILKGYVSGIMDGQELEAIEIRDMTCMPKEAASHIEDLMGDLNHVKGKRTLAGKLGNFLFAAGGITAYKFFRRVKLEADECRVLAGEPVKKAALYGAGVMGKYPISITILMKICENDPEKIKKAMEYLKDVPGRYFSEIVMQISKVVPPGEQNCFYT